MKTGRSLQDRFTTLELCRRIFERHRATIRIQKSHIAVEKMARIVEAALDLANRHGFDAMSLRELAAKADVSMGSLYSYFDSKETLLMMILEQVSLTVIEELSAPPAGLAPREHLLWLIETHIRLTEAMQKWFVFAFMEAKTFPASARRFAVDSEAATERLFRDVLERGKAEGVFAVKDASLTAALIKPLLQDWYVKRAKYKRRGTRLETYVDGVLELVLGAIAVRPLA